MATRSHLDQNYLYRKPDNPTGTINRRDEFERMMERVPDHIIVVLDEAYYEYVTAADTPTAMNFCTVKKMSSSSDLSKIYGLAG